MFHKIYTPLKITARGTQRKKVITLVFILTSLTINSYCQNNDTYKTFSTVICNYNLPLSRSGLSVTSFHVTPGIKIERWEKNAQIILNIKQEQGTSSNPNPSYTHSYNFMGKKYGNQAVGMDPFESIRAEDISYEVLVTYGSQSWGWKRVDGDDNSFGPIDKNAKASEVMVNVRVVGIQFFKGTKSIEDKIRELLKPKDTNTNNTSGSSNNPINAGSSNQNKNSTSGNSAKSANSGLPNKNQTTSSNQDKTDNTNNSTNNSNAQNNTNNSIPEITKAPEQIPDSYAGNPLTYNKTNSSGTSSGSALEKFNKGYQQGQQIAEIATGIVDLFAPTPAQLQRRAAEAAEVERQKRASAAAAEAKANKARLVAGRKNLLSKLSDGKPPLSHQAKDATEVYFFTYSYQAASLEDDAPVIYISNVFSVAKYGDGSWPFKTNLIEGIQKTYKGLDLKLSGYYLDKEKAEEQQQLLVRATTNYNFKVNNIAYTRKKTAETASANTDYWDNSKKDEVKAGEKTPKTQKPAKSESKTDFWGNQVKEGEQQPKTETEKKPASTTPKAKLDFWGNPVKE